MKKIVYVPLAADILHEGHLNILKIASKYGKVIVGLLTDAAIIQYKNLPFFDYDQRLKIVSNLKLVDEVVPQDNWNYKLILNSIKPDFFIHGDDWKTGIQSKIRLEVIKELKKWDGKLIEPKYSKNISRIIQKNKILHLGITPDQRKLQLKRLLKSELPQHGKVYCTISGAQASEIQKYVSLYSFVEILLNIKIIHQY